MSRKIMPVGAWVSARSGEKEDGEQVGVERKKMGNSKEWKERRWITAKSGKKEDGEQLGVERKKMENR